MWIVLLIVYVIVLLFTLRLCRMAKSDDDQLTRLQPKEPDE